MEHDWIILIKQTIPFFAITYLALQVELKSNDFVMLFEIKDKAEVKIPIYKITNILEKNEFIKNHLLYLQESAQLISDKQGNILEILIKKDDIYKTLYKLLKGNNLDEKQKLIYQKWIKFLLSYELWKINLKSFSYSRIMYGFSFYFLVCTMLVAIALFYISLFSNSESIQNYYIAGIGMTFICWIPLRLYCNLQVKNKLFGNEKVVTGRIEQFIPIALLVFIFLLSLLFVTSSIDIVKLSFFIMVGIICLISSFNLKFVDRTLGLKSKPITWISWLLLGIFLLYSLDIINI